MDINLICGLLTLLFFSAALAFWTYSWWTRTEQLSMLALCYCSIFTFAGLVTLVFWRATAA